MNNYYNNFLDFFECISTHISKKNVEQLFVCKINRLFFIKKNLFGKYNSIIITNTFVQTLQYLLRRMSYL